MTKDIKITDKEMLALLGYDDPPHSLSWYRDIFSNLPEMIEEFIIETLNECGAFPKESKGIDNDIRYHKFYLIIDANPAGKYIVKVNNTDRREVQKELSFDNGREAARFLINQSFTVSGSIKQYWNE
jgi:hypothetical protein